MLQYAYRRWTWVACGLLKPWTLSPLGSRGSVALRGIGKELSVESTVLPLSRSELPAEEGQWLPWAIDELLECGAHSYSWYIESDRCGSIVGGRAWWHWLLPPLQGWMLVPSSRSVPFHRSPWASLWGIGRQVVLCLLLLAQNDGENLPQQWATVVPWLSGAW